MVDLGTPVPNWRPPSTAFPSLTGRYAALTALDPSHAEALFEVNRVDPRIWDYLFDGPYETLDAYRGWVEAASKEADPYFYAIRNLENDQWGGVASYMRINPDAGSIEVGSINFSTALQRTRAATEAMVLMMTWAFEAGYRRYEWKCNALNLPSRRAAQRLGFSYEGTHRQAIIIKDHNRDTAWFSILDREWPPLRAAFETWLDPANFDTEGRQKRALSSLTAPLLSAVDPVISRS
ncbi:MAG: GNAT family protein [Pseudomonadota bacterium]